MTSNRHPLSPPTKEQHGLAQRAGANAAEDYYNFGHGNYDNPHTPRPTLRDGGLARSWQEGYDDALFLLTHPIIPNLNRN